MTKFVFGLLTLPNSSANVERTFSQINLNKTKTRNRLENNTLEGILLAKDYMRTNNKNCYEIDITNNLLSKFNANMYQCT